MNSCILERNRGGGISVAGGAAQLRLHDVEIRDTLPTLDGSGGVGLRIGGSAYVEADSLTIDGSAEIGIHFEDSATTLLTNFQILNTHGDEDGGGGYGILAEGGAVLAEDGTLAGNRNIGMKVTGPNGYSCLDQVEIKDTVRTDASGVAVGLLVADGGTVYSRALDIEDTDGPGLVVTNGSDLSCRECSLNGNSFAGAVVLDSEVYLAETAIESVSADPLLAGGVGLFVDDFTGSAVLDLEDSSITGQPNAGLYLRGSGHFSLEGNTIDGGTDALYGDALLAWGVDDPSNLILTDNEFRNAPRAGVLLHRSTAELSGNTYANNTTDLVQQDCMNLPEPTGIDEVANPDICPQELLPIPILEFTYP